MKKLQLLFTSLLLILLLAACGTAEDQNAEPDNTDQETEEETNNIEDESAKENGTQQEENANQNENQIQYTSNNETRTAETANVEEDLYTIQIMEGYELTKEEPGKELLFLQDNDAINMRIEVIPKEEADYDNLVKNTQEMMAAISDYEPFDISEAVKSHPEISNSIAYIATNENDEVVGIVYEKGNLLVRLTVYDQKDYDLKDALIKMGLTIKEK